MSFIAKAGHDRAFCLAVDLQRRNVFESMAAAAEHKFVCVPFRIADLRRHELQPAFEPRSDQKSPVASPSRVTAHVTRPMFFNSAANRQNSASKFARRASTTRLATFLGCTVMSRLRPRSAMNLRSPGVSFGLCAFVPDVTSVFCGEGVNIVLWLVVGTAEPPTYAG